MPITLEIDEEQLVRAVSLWGSIAQIHLSVEEIGEYLAEAGKVLNLRTGNHDPIRSEIAAVIIMMMQMRLLFGEDLVDRVIKRKMARIKRRMNREDKRRAQG